MFRRFIVLLVVVAFAGGWTSEALADPVIAAAGDIACAPSDSGFNGGNGSPTRCRQKYTSDLLVNTGLSAVLTLGDNQYNSASLSNFNASYDPAWGRVKSMTHPAIGNHEPYPATGYYDYFNGVGVQSGPAGDRGKGYYSVDVGAWHLIELNSNCSSVPCSRGSAQERWLNTDLAAHPNPCTLAYWHHPRFSSGHDGDNTFMNDLFTDLYSANADLVLSGHSHDYERFAPQDPSGRLDRARGIRQFVVGSGGAFWTGISSPHANSEVRQNTTYGVLRLTLHPTSYDWKFTPEAGKAFVDSGTELCHGGGTTGDTSPPTAPTNLTATAVNSNRVGLSWGASSDNVAVAGYRIFRNGTQIASSATTSYTDTTVQPSTTYSYNVAAYDTAGNTSAGSNTATATTPAAPLTQTLTFAPTDDASIYLGSPSTNFGAATGLETDNSPVKNFLLKFTVSGVGLKQVLSAKLRLYCVDTSAGSGGEYRTAASNTWSESAVTWSTAPAASSTVVASLGAVSSGRWYEVDLTPAITGDGVYSFRVTSPSSDGADYSSSEGTSTLAPQLVVTTG